MGSLVQPASSTLSAKKQLTEPSAKWRTGVPPRPPFLPPHPSTPGGSQVGRPKGRAGRASRASRASTDPHPASLLLLPIAGVLRQHLPCAKATGRTLPTLSKATSHPRRTASTTPDRIHLSMQQASVHPAFNSPHTLARLVQHSNHQTLRRATVLLGSGVSDSRNGWIALACP
jgi:hypothetical protein